MSRREAFIAPNRFALGARPGELDRIARDPHACAGQQIVVTSYSIHYTKLYDLRHFFAIRPEKRGNPGPNSTPPGSHFSRMLKGMAPGIPP